ncbi:phytoene desaturase, partial [Candidatus Saccharibacteria bacterium]|nr:phytoene desaturase [Candidatus Saccharibacteria bacterium]
MKKVVIIGAGIGGLATAALLAKTGRYQVEVIEKNAGPGGRADLLKKDGFTFDMGPSWYLMPEVFERFYTHFGRSAQSELELQKLSPAYRVFFEKQPPITVTGNLTTDAATFEAIEPGAGLSLKRYVQDAQKIYELSLRYFLYTNFSSLREWSKLISWPVIWRAHIMLQRALTPLHRFTRRYVQDQRLQQIIEYPMVFLGTSPFSAPALYSLMSALDFSSGVFYPKKGLYEISRSLEKLALTSGATITYNCEATAILTKNSQVTAVTTSHQTTLRTDIVISNGDIHHTETALLAPHDRSWSPRYWNKLQSSPSALLIYLGLNTELPQLTHHNLLFAEDWKQNFNAIYSNKTYPSPASMYVCNPSKTDHTLAPSHHENLFILVPLPSGKIPTKAEQNTLVAQYIDQFATMCSIESINEKIVSQTVFGPHDF